MDTHIMDAQEIQLKIVSLREQIKQQTKVVEEAVTTKTCLESELHKMYELELKCRLASQKFEFDKIPVIDMLKDFSIEQLEYLIYHYYGQKVVVPVGGHEQSIFSRHYTYGDVSYGIADDKMYRRWLVQYLTETSCRYCKEIGHTMEYCPKISKKFCSFLYKRY